MGIQAARSRWTSATMGLALCGFNGALVYLLIFLLPFQLSQYYTIPQPGRIWAFQNTSPQLLAVGWIVLFQLYYVAYRLCPQRPSRRTMALVAVFPVFFTLILFLMYPLGSNDIFEQIFRGHTFAHLGVSPMETMPDAFPNDPLLPYVFWRFSPGTYGPLWELTSALTSFITGTDLWRLLLAYKGLTAVHFLASMALVYATLRAWRPDFAARGFLLFAWNPLLQFEMVGNGHLDAVLIFWMLLAIYLLVKGRHILSLLALTAAVLVKFLPVLLVPLFLVALWKAHAASPMLRRLKHVAIALAAMGILTALIFAPFNGPASTLAFLGVLNTYFHSSVPWLALHTFQTQGIGGAGGAGALGIVRIILLVFTASLVLWHTWRLLRVRNDKVAVTERLLSSGYEIMFAWLLFASQYFNPWYTTWLFAFVPFLTRFGYAERAILFGFTSLAGYFVWFYRWPIGSADGVEAEIMVVWSIFLLPFLFSLGLWAFRLYRQRQGTPLMRGLAARETGGDEHLPRQA